MEAAADAVEAALRASGFGTERRDKAGGLGDIFYGLGEGMAEWIVTAPGGEQMMLQMAYFDRARRPVIMEFGPVLDLEDVISGEVCASASRVEPRDYVDTAAALDRYTVEQIIGFAEQLDPGLTDPGFRRRGGTAGPLGRRGVRLVRARPRRHRRVARPVRRLAQDLEHVAIAHHAGILLLVLSGGDAS